MVSLDSAGGDSQEPPVEDVLNEIGDSHVRNILAMIGREPSSAKQISAALDISLPTVYRRITFLEGHDLVDIHLEFGENGDHFNVYETTFDSVVISVGNEEFDVEIYRRENLPDRFSDLWDELGNISA